MAERASQPLIALGCSAIPVWPCYYCAPLVGETAMKRLDRITHTTILMALTLLCLASVVAAAGLQTAGETEEEMKKLVVMIEARLAGESSVGAGIIVGIRADNLYIATANHVVRRGALD